MKEELCPCCAGQVHDIPPARSNLIDLAEVITLLNRRIRRQRETAKTFQKDKAPHSAYCCNQVAAQLQATKKDILNIARTRRRCL